MNETPTTSPKAFLVLAFTIPLVVYVLSVHSYVGYWDVGEMDTVPWILGIAHPTGFPAYVILGWIFTHVLAIGPVALRMSLLSAFSLSVTAWLIARMIYEEHGFPAVAVSSALVFAFGDPTWMYATRAEVHAAAALATATAMYFALRWRRTGDRRCFVGACAAFATGLAIHPVAALILPGLVVLLMTRMRQIGLRTAALGAAAFAALVVAFYAYLPLRSAYVTAHRLDPTYTLGKPPGQPFWDTDHPSTANGFLELVGGAESNPGHSFVRMLSPQLYVGGAVNVVSTVLHDLTPFGAALASLGILVAFRQSPVQAIALLLCGLGGVLFILGYTNESDQVRYYLTFFVVLTLFIGWAGAWCATRLRQDAFLVPVALSICAAVMLRWGHGYFNQPHDNGAAIEAARVVAETPDNAVLVATWLYAPPLAYEAYVRHVTGRRILDTAFVSDDAQYLKRWLSSRPVYVVGDPDQPLPGYEFREVELHPPMYKVLENKTGGK
jgi:hypothetical protein